MVIQVKQPNARYIRRRPIRSMRKMVARGPMQLMPLLMTLKTNGLMVLSDLMKIVPYWLTNTCPVAWLRNCVTMAIVVRFLAGNTLVTHQVW